MQRHYQVAREEAVALPVDGLDVVEVRDPDTLRLFMLEWRRRLSREACDPPVARGRETVPGGIISK